MNLDTGGTCKPKELVYIGKLKNKHWANSTGCSGEFHFVVKHFQKLENFNSTILKEKLHISCAVSLE